MRSNGEKIKTLIRLIFPAPVRLFYHEHFGPIFRPLPMKEFEDYESYWKLRPPPPTDPKKLEKYGPFQRAVAVDRIINCNKYFGDSPISILEIGAGDGYILKYLKDKGHNVFGVDLSDTAVKIMKSKGIASKRVDIMQNKISENKYDLVQLLSVLEHIPEAESFFRSSYSYAKKYMIIAIPNLGYYKHRIRLCLVGKCPLTNLIFHIKEHVRFWTFRDFVDWTRNLGYGVDLHLGVRGTVFLKTVFPSLFASTIVYVVSKRS